MKIEDALLIGELRENGRSSLTDVSKRIHVPVSTLHARLQKFTPQVIPRITALLDFYALGFGVRAVAWIKVGKSKESNVQDILRTNPFVNTAWEITSLYDFVIEIIGRSMKDVEQLKERLRTSGATQVKLSYIVADIAREQSLRNDTSMLTDVTPRLQRNSSSKTEE